MTAEGRPQGEESLLARPLAWGTGWILRRPGAVLVAAAVLAAASLLYAANGLGFHTSRLDLLNPDSHFNKLWLAYLEEFGDQDDAVVVIEGPSPETIAPVRRELAGWLARETDHFEAVLHEVDLSRLRAKGLHFLPREQLEQLEAWTAQAEPLAQGDWTFGNLPQRVRRLNEALAASGQALARSPVSAAAAEAASTGMEPLLFEAEQVAAHLTAALAGEPPSSVAANPLAQLEHSLGALARPNSDYLRTRDGWMGFVLLRLAPYDRGAAGGGHPAIVRLREVIAEVQARRPQVRIGLTGMPVLEDDEMEVSRRDMAWANGVSFVGVALLFVAALGGWRHPLLCNLTLLIGMAWSVGYITLAVGHLNLLSVTFGVILIGLGVDYGVHLAARYLQVRREMAAAEQDESQHSALEIALRQAARGVGPAIVTGSATTALAFFTAGLTPFTGVAELGVIAGGGILLCCAAALVVLPALIAAVDHHWPGARPPQARDLAWLVRPAMRWPRAVVGLALGITLLLALGLPRLGYDPNLLHLQAGHLESVRLERKLLEETDRSVWFAVSMADTPEELLRRKALFEQLPMVDRTEEIASLAQAADEAKAAAIARIAARLEALPERPPWLDVAPPEQLAAELAGLHQALAALGPAAAALPAQWAQVQKALQRLTPRQYYERLSPYQQTLAAQTLEQFRALGALADPQPPQLTDLPPSLAARFVGKTNRQLLKIYGRGDIWEIENLEQFVRQVKEVDPRATGHPLQTYYASKQMQQSYFHAAVYALLAVGIVLMLDFRSVRDALLALAPVALAMVQMFGLMAWFDLPLNPANLIGLPLMLGIGVDNGVHLLHDFRAQVGRYRTSPSTVMAVLLASLTTIIGFGSLLLAGHQGIRSLGLTLTIGMTCCLASSLAVLPAVLTLLRGEAADQSARRPPAPSPEAAPVTLRRRAPQKGFEQPIG